MKAFVATVVAALACLGTTSAFINHTPIKNVVSRSSSLHTPTMIVDKFFPAETFETAMAQWAEENPDFAEIGWGPTPLAERWNGRHAMFGWVALILTGFAQSHNLIPNPEAALDLKEWGTLAIISGTKTITNERAVILLAHVHALVWSVMATFAPLGKADKLFLEKGEEMEAPAGYFPPFSTGLTRDAEMWNGRMAMLGLIVVVLNSAITGTPILKVIDGGLGGLLL